MGLGLEDINRPVSSRLWRRLSWVWEELRECLAWSIRDGRNTNFWYDSWLCRESPLVSECILEMAPRPLMIMAELPPNGDAGPDIADWRLEDRQTGQGSLRFFVGFYGRIAVAALWGLNVSTARSCWSEIFMGHALVIEIKGLMRRGCDLSVKHILRECNACADRMAALGRGREATSMEYEDPPVELLDLIREEASSFFDQS
ncbi:hypothetical protein V6N12_067065 [Hibiscus sabdariffa]|uniref:RNase H type-1 domain-containing protein n=1 Tax=Hibiscus sabdariffa TaxID=183260 RepID=A0ABR1ZKB2_9ROSI